ncbi:MAG TPA: hypothetical protein VME68_04255 [Acidobacteriaceae bacterium]|nr:hypothetical protein [Acidobacteriaceae bacterium]
MRACLSALPLLAVAGVPALADVAAVHRDRLPQTPPVLAALDDAAAMEPYSDRWSNKWIFPVPKKDVAEHLRKDITALQAAVKDNPTNEELLLVAGLVAHYGYNVDVEHTDESAPQDLAAAGKLDPNDFRVSWFHADFMCQTIKPSVGAKEFLSIEGSHAWRDLPAAFWRNYEHCAAVTNMPAHLLRAAGYLSQLAPSTDDDKFYESLGHDRMTAVDLTRDYDTASSWTGDRDGDDVAVTSTACGVRFRARSTWTPDRLELQKGSCVAVFSTGPYKAPRGPLHPEILLIAQRPEGSETLADFAQKFTKLGTFSPMTPAHCPASHCLAMQGVQPGIYTKDGDGHPRIVVFERDEPPNPGLLFESPQDPPAQGQGTQVIRPNRMLERIPGTLYYVIALDTASTIEQSADNDFDFFLEHTQVE